MGVYNNSNVNSVFVLLVICVTIQHNCGNSYLKDRILIKEVIEYIQLFALGTCTLLKDMYMDRHMENNTFLTFIHLLWLVINYIGSYVFYRANDTLDYYYLFSLL